MRVFIVSTGRTGTQSLAYLFSQLDDSIVALHEPVPSRRFRILSNMRACGKVSPQVCSSHFLRLRKQYLSPQKKYVESNNFLFGIVDVLSERLNAKVLHVVRHPLDYANSHIKHGAFKGLKGLASNYFPYWLAQPGRYGAAESRWRSLPEIERLFWNWTLVNQTVSANCARLGSSYRVVRYEDIFFDDSALLNVLDWAGLPLGKFENVSNLRLNRLNVGKGSAPNSSIENLEAMESICGDLMSDLGYSRER